MSSLLPFLIVGLVSGSLYGLAGLGLVLSYRTSGVFNFGYGAIAAAAAFVFYTLHVTNGLAWPLAGLITMAIFGLGVGLLMERVTRALTQSSEVVIVAFTVGIILAVEGLLGIQYGDVTRYFPPFLPASGFKLDGVLISWGDVICASVALAAAVLLYAFLRLTRLGTAMRGVVDNPTLVSLTGERPVRVNRVAWGIGCSFAAAAGILLAPTLGLDANLLTLLVVQAFGACAIGAFTNLPLTYVGGLVVGVAASFATKYFVLPPWDGLSPAMPFLILIVVLLLAPLRFLPKGRPPLVMAPRRSMSKSAGRRWILVIAGAVLLVIPWVSGTYLPAWESGLTYMIIFSSLGLLLWTAGEISLCAVAFVALGATTMAHLHHDGVPWLLALLLAGLITAPVGALIAIPAVRLSGIYLALLTLGFGIFMQEVVFQSALMFGAPVNVSTPRPNLWFIHGTSDRTFYYIIVVCLLAAFGLLALVQRSQLGRLLRAMAETPRMLVTNGLNTITTRLLVFSLSAFVAGVGGALMVTQFGNVEGQNFGPEQSLILVTVLVICGTRMLLGAAIAGLLYAVLPGYVHSFTVDEQTFAFGLAAMVAALVLAQREGLAAWIREKAHTSDNRLEVSPVRDRARIHTPTEVLTGSGIGL